jgi:hypothetical protein
MRPVATPPSQPLVTLHRHLLALVASLTATAFPGGALLIFSLTHHNGAMASAILVITSGIACMLIISWRVFAITVRADRVRVRRLYRGRIHNSYYRIPGMRGLDCIQHPLGMLLNIGTLVLLLPDRTLRFTMLTPYGALRDALG